MEIVVDTYTEEECATAWHCHLDGQISFPFKARVRQVMEASPLKAGEIITVVALAHEQLCRAAIFVAVKHGDRDIVAPLGSVGTR